MKKILLTQNKHALVDAKDFVKLSLFRWRAYKNGKTHYAVTDLAGKIVKMHRMIMGSSGIIDHKNCNGLDNQRKNLRIATRSQNKMNTPRYKNNTSEFKGVTWVKNTEKWRVRIGLNGKQIHLGYFTNKEKAFTAYVEGCNKYHGEFARIK